MYLDAVLVVDIAHDVIAGDGMATGGEDELVDVLLGDDEWLLLVEVFAHDEQFLRFGSSFVFLFLFLVFVAQEWDVAAPTASLALFLVLALQLVAVFFPQQDGMVAEGEEEVVVVLYVMVVAEFIYNGSRYFHRVLLQPFVENVFSLLLYLSVVASQDGLYLALGLGGAYEVNP